MSLCSPALPTMRAAGLPASASGRPPAAARQPPHQTRRLRRVDVPRPDLQFQEPRPAGGGAGGSPNTLAAYSEWVKRTFGDKADQLLKLYPAKDDAGARTAYHDVYRDINFAGHRTWAKLQATTGKAPAYLYMFSHLPPHPAGNGNNPAAPNGAVHFSEVIYVFDNLRMKDQPWTDVDRKVADTLASYFVNFAKTGDPNGSGLSNWPAYNPNDEFWMNLGDVARMERFNSAGVDFIAAAQEEVRRAR